MRKFLLAVSGCAWFILGFMITRDIETQSPVSRGIAWGALISFIETAYLIATWTYKGVSGKFRKRKK